MAHAIKTERRRGASQMRSEWLALASTLTSRRIPVTFLPATPVTLAVAAGPRTMLLLVPDSDVASERGLWTWPLVGVTWRPEAPAIRVSGQEVTVTASLARRLGTAAWTGVAAQAGRWPADGLSVMSTDGAIEVLAALAVGALPPSLGADWPELARLYRHRGQWLVAPFRLASRYGWLVERDGRVQWPRPITERA